MTLWFKAKRYGYGWTPCTWQGWAILLAYCFAIVSCFVVIDRSSHSASDTLFVFIPFTIFLTILLIILCVKKGEKPRWRWGGDDSL